MITSDAIHAECDRLCDTLTRKNHDYGGSAFRVPVLCPEVDDPTVLIRARMSDKIERLGTLLTMNSPPLAQRDPATREQIKRETEAFWKLVGR